jgi:hypothetical protein
VAGLVGDPDAGEALGAEVSQRLELGPERLHQNTACGSLGRYMRAKAPVSHIKNRGNQAEMDPDRK